MKPRLSLSFPLPLRQAVRRISGLAAGALSLSFLLTACKVGSSGVIEAAYVADTKDWYVNSRPAWSPDGDEIAVGDRRSIFIYRISADLQSRLTRTIKVPRVVSIRWSPDGRQLLLEQRVEKGFIVTQRPLIIDLKTGGRRIIDWSGGKFFWLDRQKLGALEEKDGYGSADDMVSLDLRTGKKQVLFRNTEAFEVLGILGGRYIMTETALSVRVFDLRTARRHEFRLKNMDEISIADNGRAVVIPSPKKLGDVDNEFTGHDARITATGLKVGKRLIIRDKKGQEIHYLNTSVSPDGRLLAFRDLNVSWQSLYISRLP